MRWGTPSCSSCSTLPIIRARWARRQPLRCWPGGGTALSLRFDPAFYGFGFLAGAAVLFLAALLRLDWFTRNLPYRILGQQPLAAAEEKDKEA